MILIYKIKGFTLIEISIVLIIMAILMSVGYATYTYYIGAARTTRLNNYASAMMSAARLANGLRIAKGLDQNSLFTQGDGKATYGWPSANEICNLIEQQINSGQSTGLSASSAPISCDKGVLKDVSTSNSNCKATYIPATDTASAYIDTSQVTSSNCM